LTLDANIREMAQIRGLCTKFLLWSDLKFGLNREGYSCYHWNN